MLWGERTGYHWAQWRPHWAQLSSCCNGCCHWFQTFAMTSFATVAVTASSAAAVAGQARCIKSPSLARHASGSNHSKHPHYASGWLAKLHNGFPVGLGLRVLSEGPYRWHSNIMHYIEVEGLKINPSNIMHACTRSFKHQTCKHACLLLHKLFQPLLIVV